MRTIAIITLAAMTPVFLMMWFDDLEAHREIERLNQVEPEAKP